ncbi:MAG: hypothetical protein ACRDWE_02325, partial [Acidimicrobiales bacterium]
MNPRVRHSFASAAASLGAVALAGSVLLAAGAAGAPPASAHPRSSKGGACDVSVLAKHKGTVHVDFWESMVTANGKTLAALTAKFNSSQSKGHVTLVQQKSYTTTWV